jgi:hypothetical protein
MDLVITNTSRMDYYGGETQELSLFKNAEAYLYGGRVDFISSHQFVAWVDGKPIGQHIHIDAHRGWEWKYENGEIRGIAGLWQDGSAFDIRFINDPDYDPTWTNINVVPEPMTVLLMGVGGLLLRRSWRA